MRLSKFFIPLVVVIGIAAFQSIFIVQEINQAIVLQFGDPKKIVTKSGTKMNSWKKPVIGNPGIDLCAGDDPNTLQPMVMGLHMVSAMRETHQQMQEILKIVVDLCNTLSQVCVATATHTHPVAIPVTGPETSAALHMQQMIDIVGEGQRRSDDTGAAIRLGKMYHRWSK